MTPVKESYDPPRGWGPLVENHWLKRSVNNLDNLGIRHLRNLQRHTFHLLYPVMGSSSVQSRVGNTPFQDLWKLSVDSSLGSVPFSCEVDWKWQQNTSVLTVLPMAVDFLKVYHKAHIHLFSSWALFLYYIDTEYLLPCNWCKLISVQCFHGWSQTYSTLANLRIPNLNIVTLITESQRSCPPMTGLYDYWWGSNHWPNAGIIGLLKILVDSGEGNSSSQHPLPSPRFTWPRFTR